MLILKKNINRFKNNKLINLVGNNIKPGLYLYKKISNILKILKLNLIQISNNKNILFKIINYSKYLYNYNKKKKNKNKNKIKNIKITPNINLYDLKYRIKKIKQILKKKHILIKINMFLRGRNVLFSNNKLKIFQFILTSLNKKFLLIKKPFIKNKNIIMIISNKKK
ncbi:MAG: hypothetical protein ABNO52_00415 [Candidatus Shikimatogenerans sp. Tser]|uniref:Translation initiation factor IF-3 n=1 Tax=Candidatus Shikimatogenerans sp. Tser TaxID=3158568 RepID=A0AAU7QQK1_9FLAO